MPRIPYSRYKLYPRPLQGGARVVAGPGGPPTIAGSYQAALDRANRANEQRYQQILSGYDQLRARVMGGLDGYGQAERADIDREYRNAASNVYNSLVNRGFGNGSLGATMQQGVSRERMAAKGRLNDRLSQQRAAYDMGISQGKLGVMERRYDNGPDINQMLALYQGLGRAGYGGGGMRLGQPIGIAPDAYQAAYQNFYLSNLAKMQSGPMYQGGIPMANIRAQASRLEKYGKGPQAKPAAAKPFKTGPYGNIPLGPFADGYRMPLTVPGPAPGSVGPFAGGYLMPPTGQSPVRSSAVMPELAQGSGLPTAAYGQFSPLGSMPVRPPVMQTSPLPQLAQGLGLPSYGQFYPLGSMPRRPVRDRRLTLKDLKGEAKRRAQYQAVQGSRSGIEWMLPPPPRPIGDVYDWGGDYGYGPINRPIPRRTY